MVTIVTFVFMGALEKAGVPWLVIVALVIDAVAVLWVQHKIRYWKIDKSIREEQRRIAKYMATQGDQQYEGTSETVTVEVGDSNEAKCPYCESAFRADMASCPHCGAAITKNDKGQDIRRALTYDHLETLEKLKLQKEHQKQSHREELIRVVGSCGLVLAFMVFVLLIIIK